VLSQDSAPRVTVITTVFNGRSYSQTAIPSILEQSYVDFEYVIVDDGSKDDTTSLLRELCGQDSRARIFSPGRLGRSKALNYAVGKARGEYIANQDFDDISYSNRLSNQVAFLDAHPRVGEVSAYFIQDDEQGQHRSVQRPPTTHQGIVRAMARCVPICHTLAMFRKLAWAQVGGYSHHMGQDFLLSISIAALGWELANIPEVLGEHCEYSQSFFHSAVNQRSRQLEMARLQWQAIRKLGLPLWTGLYPFGRFVVAHIPALLQSILRRRFGGYPGKQVRELDASGT
jgi:glycosyltransferase EpsE